MCFGFDGRAALERTGVAGGIGRRTVLRGAVATAAAAGVAGLATGTASPASAVANNTRASRVPLDRISLQLWTMRSAFGWPDAAPAEQKERYRATLRQVATVGYPRVELALGYFGHTPAELRRFLRSLGIRPTSGHDGLTDTDAALEAKLEAAATLGQRYTVVPYLEAPLTLTPAERRTQWQRWADRMNVEAAAARGYGIKLGYHNHAHEFGDDLGGDTTPWDVLTSELDPRLVHLELDLYWIATGLMWSGRSREATVENEIIDRIRAIPQKVRQYHVKDRDPGQPANRTDGAQSFADPGTGLLDFGRIFDANAAEEYIVENDQPDVSPLTTARVGHTFLRTLVFEGRR